MTVASCALPLDYFWFSNDGDLSAHWLLNQAAYMHANGLGFAEGAD